MALLQISEPGESTVPHEHRNAAGIDLGTTNSLVATVRSGEAVCLPDEDGRSLLPSVVNFSNTQVLVGYQAQALQTSDPLNSIASIKRLMGRAQQELVQLGDVVPYEFVTSEDSNVPRIRTRGGDLTAVEISAEILKTLAHRATQSIGGDLEGVVITVPAYFDDAQRQATRDAAILAGLNLFRLLNEPTAAAVAYGLEQDADGLIAVYDLGGNGTDGNNGGGGGAGSCPTAWGVCLCVWVFRVFGGEGGRGSGGRGRRKRSPRKRAESQGATPRSRSRSRPPGARGVRRRARTRRRRGRDAGPVPRSGRRIDTKSRRPEPRKPIRPRPESRSHRRLLPPGTQSQLASHTVVRRR